MNPHELDITHTVKPSVANGRRLFKNLLTGETRWMVSCLGNSKPIPGYEQLEVFAPAPPEKARKKHKGEVDA